jgi:LmbE family N-acetylglucosaminyl deacetylase
VVTRPQSLLAVMAHPDDAELWAGGTLALHARSATVTIAVERSGSDRLAEAARGAAVLGARLLVIDRHTPRACAELLDRVRPEVVITHHLDDVHPDHRRAATALMGGLPDIVIATGRPRRVYSCDTYEGLTRTGPVAAGTIVDVTATYEQKLRALAAHTSQPLEHFGGMADRLTRLWGARIGTERAEAFLPLPVLGRLPGATHL